MGAHGEVAGPDFSQGIPLNDIPEEGTLAGRVGEEALIASDVVEALGEAFRRLAHDH